MPPDVVYDVLYGLSGGCGVAMSYLPVEEVAGLPADLVEKALDVWATLGVVRSRGVGSGRSLELLSHHLEEDLPYETDFFEDALRETPRVAEAAAESR